MTARLRLTVVSAVATLLAAMGLSSVFVDSAWVWPVVFAVAVSTGGCALARRLGAPRFLVPAVGLVALVLYITWIYAAHAVWGFIPGPGAIRSLHSLLVVAGDDIGRYATPAPTSQALLLIAAAGLGATAIAVDTLAVTCRSAALAGAPLLAVYAVPASVARGGVPWVLFVVAALGWLALMLAEGRERLSGWGRALGRRSSRGDGVFTSAPAEPLGVVGRRIGAAALGLAVIFPAVMPLLGNSLFGGGNGVGSGSGTGSGGGSDTVINPLVSIGSDLTARSNTAVLTYTTNDANPDYLRMITLDAFDVPSGTWKVARLTSAGGASSLDSSKSDPLPGARVTSKITMTGLKTPWLPLPYPTETIRGLSGDWSYDDSTLDVFGRGGTTTLGRNYTVTSRHPALDADNLRAVGDSSAETASRYVSLPSGIPAAVKSTEEQIVKGLTNEYDKALAIQQFFLDPKNNFTYNVQVPAFDGSPLVGFLTNRTGFCQQFATMYAIMAREAGLPTRINVGFTHGTATSPGHWTVTRNNAHAWPEVFFQGVGWVRFEPTPSAPTGTENPAYAPPPGTAGNDPNTGQPLPAIGSRGAKNGRLNDADIGNDGTTTKTTKPIAVTASQTGKHLLTAGGVLAAVLLALSPGSARIIRRRRRLGGGRRSASPGARVLEAWHELGDTGRDLGVPWSPARTPRRTAEALVAYGVRGDSAAAVRRLARAVERVRYARADVDVLAGHDPGSDARLVLKALAAASTSKVRWRARLLPGSVLTVAGTWAGDALDWVDGLGARLRGEIGRLLPSRLTGG